MTIEENVTKTIDRVSKLRSDRSNWDNHWQLIAQYMLTRKSDFTTSTTAGEFLNSDLFDSTAPDSIEKAAGAFAGLVWNEAGRAFSFEPIDDDMIGDKEVEEWYDHAAEVLMREFNNSKTGFSSALDEFLQDEITFGTACMALLEGTDTLLSFKTWHLKEYVVEENFDGFVDTIYRTYMMRADEMVNYFGEDNVHQKILEESRKDGTKKHEVIHCIKPRKKRGASGKGNKSLPFAEIYIDKYHKHVMMEGGYNEQPFFVSRFLKKSDEVYGRSPAMKALPDVMELNAVMEAFIVGVERLVDPPYEVENDAIAGSGIINISAGSVTVVNTKGSSNTGRSQAIRPIQTGFNPQVVFDFIGMLKESITQKFYLDRLLDFNNNVQMTATETIERSDIRSLSLRSPIARLTTEFLTPMIERAFNIAFRKGAFGVVSGSKEEELLIAKGMKPKVIPQKILDAMQRQSDAYRINYLTTAVQEANEKEVQAIAQLIQYSNALAQINPEVFDNFDVDATIKRIQEIKGIQSDVFKDSKEVKQVRQARQEQQQLLLEQQEAQVQQQQAQAQQAQGQVASPQQ